MHSMTVAHFTDTWAFSATDGTNQTITVSITGADDAPVVSGTLTGSVAEEFQTPQPQRVRLPSLMSMQTISPAFADLASLPLAITLTAPSHSPTALWTYTLDNANSTVDALDDGDTLTDTSSTFSATDGTNQTITVSITGADDAPVVSGTLTGSVTENSDTTAATGSLAIADVDADDFTRFC